MRGIVISLLALVFLFQGVDIQAQSQKVTDYLEELQQQSALFFNNTPENRQVHYGKVLEGYNSFDPVQSWILSTNPNPSLNFNAYGAGTFAGDINGDGLNDMIFSTTFARDERTPDLESNSPKTAVFFGDNRTGTPDQIVYEYLIPVGDLNGDGYADAFAMDQENQLFLLFTGSAEGYQATGQSIDLIAYSEAITFMDLDGDGYQDVLFHDSMVNNNQSQVTVFWGADDLENAEVELYNLSVPVAAESIAFNAGSFTSDGKDELIAIVSDYDALQTANVNQTILRWSFDESRTPDLVQAVDVDSIFTGFASFMTLIPIDVNGNGSKELFIHEPGNQSDKYLFTYDSETNLLDEEPVLLYDNQAIPVGDLNNNGRYDFIAGDPDNSYYPYVAFGPENLEDGLTLDVEIQGDTDENWSWSIPGNIHAGFGDLNGDGIDDLIMSHTQINEQTLGRRYLLGSETGNFGSDFVHYPREYFFSAYNATLDLGDFNNNGYNDLAVLSLTQQKIDIYFGSSGTLQKNLTIEFESSILNMSTGDFNGDGTPDLLVGYNGGSSIDIFFGGETISDAPDVSIDPDDFVFGDTFSSAYFPFNIGDVNNDGYDDFAATSLFVQNEDGSGPLREIYLFFGGESFSGLPDLTLLATEDPQSFTGFNLTALGDINGDGIDDFAFANPNIANGNSTFGEVRIYYGNDEGIFDEPDLIIYPEYNEGGFITGFGSGITTGDFNGDGVMDLAVGSQTFTGNPAVVIYYGGSEISSQPAEKLWIPLDSGLGGPNTSDQYSERLVPNLRSIPDLTGNGKDELLVSEGGLGGARGTNAALFLGESFGAEMIVPSAYLKAPNQSTGLGGNFSSAVADFSQDGSVSAVLLQIADNNDAMQSSRMYQFNLTEIANASRPQVVVTAKDTVGQAGGTVSSENDGVSVLIPENALEEDTEIEFGTFNIIPDGAEISGLMIYLGPSGLTFNEPVEVTVTYDPDNLPSGIIEEELVLLRYDEMDMAWEELPTDVNTVEKMATGTTMKFSGFAAGVLSGSVSNEEIGLGMPDRFELNQNYPNPFNPATVITYALPADAEVALEVFNMLGQRVAVLVDELQRAGRHEARFASGNLASGMYLYRLTTPEFVQTRKMLLIK